MTRTAALLVLIASLNVTYASTSCLSARNKCTSRIGCSMALTNFFIACESVRLGQVDYCTDSCMRAVVSLVTVDDDIGTDYLTCDCDGSQDCELIKRRISLCSTGVLEALRSLDSESAISCSLARMLCEADTRCWTALSYYEGNCSQLWSKHTDSLACGSKCNNSVRILFRQTRATKLRTCMCDNTDPFIDEGTCIRMRYNTETYCFGQEPQGPFFSTSSIKKTKYDNYSKDHVYKASASESSANSPGTSHSFNLLLTLAASSLTLLLLL